MGATMNAMAWALSVELGTPVLQPTLLDSKVIQHSSYALFPQNLFLWKHPG